MSALCRDDLQPFFDDSLWNVIPFSAVQNSLLPVRSASRLPQDAKSVIVMLFPYLLEEEYYKNSRLSRFCIPADYHLLCGQMLQEQCDRLQAAFPQNRFASFVDASPIPEVFAAACAGLGVVGKNGLLIHEKYGSWVFIGEIVTDLAIGCEVQPVGSCIGCDACLHACPTGALQNGVVHTDRCLSHISQKKKLTEEDAQLLKENNTLWGCDRCQTACPMNRRAAPTKYDIFRTTACSVPVENDADRAYAWRKNAVFRNLELLK